MAPLNEVRVLAAGVDVVAESGWAALSLRSVAEALGVTPMALYRHIVDSDKLRAGVLNRVVESLAQVSVTDDLEACLADWARRFHRDLDRYPGVAAHLLTAWFDCPAMLERVEDLLGLVSDHGLEGFEAVATVNAVMMFVLMRSEAERVVRAAGVVRRSLRTDRSRRPLPLLQSLAPHYTTARFDAHFEFGLSILMRGLRLDDATRTTPC